LNPDLIEALGSAYTFLWWQDVYSVNILQNNVYNVNIRDMIIL
jgi:hypothetical protein